MDLKLLTSWTLIESGQRFVFNNSNIDIVDQKKISIFHRLKRSSSLGSNFTKINDYIEKHREEIINSAEARALVIDLKARLSNIAVNYQQKHCWLYRVFFGWNVSRKFTKIDKTINELLKVQPKQFEKINLPEELQKTLNNLFEGSSSSCENMPVYPHYIKEGIFGFGDLLKWMKSTSKSPFVMGYMGSQEEARPYIAIVVKNTFDEEATQNKLIPKKDGIRYKEDENYFRWNSGQESLIILHEHYLDCGRCWGGKGENMWYQSATAYRFKPVFIPERANFTYAGNGKGPTKSQESNFKLLQEFLKNGEGADSLGVKWKIAFS